MLSLSSPRNSALLAVFLLAACSQPPQTNDSNSAALHAPAYATPKKYEAISRTAEAITGGLEIANGERAGENAPPRVKLTFGLGHVYEGDWVETSLASADIAGEAWTATLPVPGEAEVSVYSIASETLKPDTPNGGLCNPAKVQFLAVAAYRNAMGEDELQMAAFSDPQWPPVGAPQLCGTFTYIAAE